MQLLRQEIAMKVMQLLRQEIAMKVMQLLRQETATIYKIQDNVITWNTFY